MGRGLRENIGGRNFSIVQVDLIEICYPLTSLMRIVRALELDYLDMGLGNQ